jgi:hypothetical protein
MNTMTLNTAFVARTATETKPVKPSLYARLKDAIIQSRQAKAELETRRILSMLDRNATPFEYALLPFRGE